MKKGVPMLVLLAVTSQAAEIKHRFLAKDESRAQLHYVDQFDASNDWTIKLEKGCRDIRMIGDERVLVSYPTGYAEFDLATQKKVAEVRDPSFKNTESVTRLENGNTILGMNKKGVRFVEVTPAGAVVRSVDFPQFKKLRLMRLSPEGHFLFGANISHVIEADWAGQVLMDFELAGSKHIYWVQKLDGGKLYRVSTGYGHSIVDVTPDGTVVRSLGEDGDYFFFCCPFELKNGNTVVSNWTGHKPADSKKGPQLLEFNPKGDVVWQWHDAKRAGTIHGLIILNDDWL